MCSPSTDRVNCQVCGRSRRVPPELMPNAQYFVCRDCVARAFPDLRDRHHTDFRNISTTDIESTLYDPYASERLEEPPRTADDAVRSENRLKAMERAKSQMFEIKRVTSTFFKVNSSGNVETVPTTRGSLELSDLAVDDDDGTCKICMENPATIILLPCGHGGLCQGCAKDLVLAGKTCYICREEFTMLAEMNQKWSKSEAVITATSDHEEDQRKEEAEYLGRMIRPDALHHVTSSARDDGQSLLVAAGNGDTLDAAASLPLSGNADTDDTSATERHVRDTMQPQQELSSGTLASVDRKAGTAVIAL
ncbi:hypothetical protein Pmar_PMAR015469 [Perkinsus marinus ATCC 50983]|uniref:RING-type domain-containing protein n=1 Tax=Perkinsus marinus (strain ATCC 50983 / TXsc) TaxID=423536 RepID=C5L8A0_PERM5|nr:hypothetical protein Pmar_PMAR015469 [Perkinsus marinus ATCC 50983]EER07056.1 hypothetical protein Pmar_PMAR015469 [Perkinsus marinus ATCC 50983]|eukprot:XP_002775240.1 hypothetical protein Pmar_PMAR015469 [Perkinsus marinus ATCC 50983]